jgi:predicted XRE-type DNA-binding protein
MPKKKIDSTQDLISQAEAARLRDVSRASISELIKRGRLSTATVGGRVFVRRTEILNFEEQKRGPKTKG